MYFFSVRTNTKKARPSSPSSRGVAAAPRATLSCRFFRKSLFLGRISAHRIRTYGKTYAKKPLAPPGSLTRCGAGFQLAILAGRLKTCPTIGGGGAYPALPGQGPRRRQDRF